MSRSKPPARSESTVKAWSSAAPRLREVGKGCPSELKPVLDRRLDGLVRGRGNDEHEQAVELEALDRLLGQDDMADVGRVEGAAEKPSRHASSNSTTASGFTPAAAQILLGRLAANPIAPRRAEDAERALSGRPRPVDEEVGELDVFSGRRDRLGDQLEERPLELVDRLGR